MQTGFFDLSMGGHNFERRTPELWGISNNVRDYLNATSETQRLRAVDNLLFLESPAGRIIGSAALLETIIKHPNHTGIIDEDFGYAIRTTEQAVNECDENGILPEFSLRGKLFLNDAPLLEAMHRESRWPSHSEKATHLHEAENIVINAAHLLVNKEFEKLTTDAIVGLGAEAATKMLLSRFAVQLYGGDDFVAVNSFLSEDWGQGKGVQNCNRRWDVNVITSTPFLQPDYKVQVKHGNYNELKKNPEISLLVIKNLLEGKITFLNSARLLEEERQGKDTSTEMLNSAAEEALDTIDS